MGYIDTEHYHMKKPEASNKFDVADLNNALDQVDSTMYEVDTRIQVIEEWI